MEIGMVYSSKDPRQARARAFVKDFVRERGILALFVEKEQPVEIPTITINGCSVVSSAAEAGEKGRHQMRFPSLEDISRALERGFWCV